MLSIMSLRDTMVVFRIKKRPKTFKVLGRFHVRHVIARYEAIPDCTGRICLAALPHGDCFVPRNDVAERVLLIDLHQILKQSLILIQFNNIEPVRMHPLQQ